MPHVEPKAMEALCNYDWPGNMHELKNCVEQAVVLAPGDEVTCDLLPIDILEKKSPRAGEQGSANLDALVAELIEQGITAAGSHANNLSTVIVDRVEKELILHVLADCENVQTSAADRLGINRNTFGRSSRSMGCKCSLLGTDFDSPLRDQECPG